MNTITKEEMEKAIQQFCIYMQDWIDSAFPKKSDVSTEAGLCKNLKNYLHNLFKDDLYRLFRITSEDYLHTEVFFNCCFPFNTNRDEYVKEEVSHTFYQNEKRLAFIKEWATKELK